MNLEDEDPALAGALSFFFASGREPPASEALLARGRAARVLAASKPGGLLLNVEAPELSFFIADGMDIRSQLVSVSGDPDVHAALKRRLSDDIRITAHAQHPVEFLGDVRDHRFDLIVFGALDPPAARLAAAGLAPGGLLALFPDRAPDASSQDELGHTLANAGLLVSAGIEGSLIAARAPEGLKPKRRGGRRKRPPARG